MAEPYIEKVEAGQLEAAVEDAEALNRFFGDASQALEALGFFLGPVRYTVQRRIYHDQLHHGHGNWTFVCLRREARHHVFFSDKRYVMSLELDNEYERSHPFDFAIYSRTHFDEIRDVLMPFANRLSEETGRGFNFHHRDPEGVPDILDC